MIPYRVSDCDDTVRTMAFTTEAIHRLAALARLALSDAEAEQMAHELDGVFALLDRLQAAPTDGVEPLAHPLELTQRLRDDAVTEPDRRDALMALAPLAENDLYLVPKVIES